MNGYYIRFFSLAPLSSTTQLQVWLAERHHYVRPLGTNRFEVFDDPVLASLHVILNTARDEVIRQEVMAFIEAAARARRPASSYVMDRLARSQAVVALQGWQLVDEGIVDETLTACYAISEGLVQIDGEGFFEQGVFILGTDD
ncbi:MAG TPA: hypothetical protein PKD09_00085 [Aggregatilinea sp.]|uniref:hypothetical protein n=1 Tax=Aggregatilinea sp. TaxID=2806333 RepID=UPI002BD4EDE5|nr:hypothetical protein [Aggregatilinea sp.]HML20013.1 hypothetical protein [Aggregatilinea sp.]